MANYKDNNGGRTRRKKRMRTHGFLKRMLTSTGKNVIKRRRAKGRHRLAVSSKGWSFSRR